MSRPIEQEVISIGPEQAKLWMPIVDGLLLDPKAERFVEPPSPEPTFRARIGKLFGQKKALDFLPERRPTTSPEQHFSALQNRYNWLRGRYEHLGKSTGPLKDYYDGISWLAFDITALDDREYTVDFHGYRDRNGGLNPNIDLYLRKPTKDQVYTTIILDLLVAQRRIGFSPHMHTDAYLPAFEELERLRILQELMSQAQKLRVS